MKSIRPFNLGFCANAVRCILFVCLVLLFLACPVALFIAQNALHCDLPLGGGNSKEATYLLGRNTDVNVRASLTLTGLTSGDFQESFETEVENFIPGKSSALLASAAIQRSLIRTSNALFAWECYPTYFGSDVIYAPGLNLLTNPPVKDSEGIRESLEAFAVQLAEYAERYPEKRFCVIVPDCSQISTALPTSGVVSCQIDKDLISETMTSKWEGSTNILLSIAVSEEPGQFVQRHYHTDGHWNGHGALYAYDELRSLMPELAEVDSVDSFTGPVFNGQVARKGLMLLDETAKEPALPVSSLFVESGISGWILAEDPLAEMSNSPLDAEFNFYASWYGTDASNVIVSKDKSGNAVLVSDSYGDAFRWVLAQSFGRVHNFLDLYGSSKGQVTLGDRIKEADADTVVFVGLPTDYSTFLERHPGYFAHS